jgi:hypothetical protein
MHRRGVRIRVCEDRSDVLFDLSAAEVRRFYTPKSGRDQSDAYLMLMPFSTAAYGLRELGHIFGFLGKVRD